MTHQQRSALYTVLVIATSAVCSFATIWLIEFFGVTTVVNIALAFVVGTVIYSLYQIILIRVTHPLQDRSDK